MSLEKEGGDEIGWQRNRHIVFWTFRTGNSRTVSEIWSCFSYDCKKHPRKSGLHKMKNFTYPWVIVRANPSWKSTGNFQAPEGRLSISAGAWYAARMENCGCASSWTVSAQKYLSMTGSIHRCLFTPAETRSRRTVYFSAVYDRISKEHVQILQKIIGTCKNGLFLWSLFWDKKKRKSI